MMIYVVVEGDFDKRFIEKLLHNSPAMPTTTVVTGGSVSGAESLAISFAMNGKRVVLLVDADSIDPTLVAERKRFIETSLRRVTLEENWRVIIAAPELEVVFFEDKGVVDRLLGVAISDSDFIRGKYSPKSVLTTFGGRDKTLRNLKPEMARDIVRAPLVQELFNAIHELGQRARSPEAFNQL